MYCINIANTAWTFIFIIYFIQSESCPNPDYFLKKEYYSVFPEVVVCVFPIM